MPFIPNFADAGFQDQAEPDSIDFQILLAGHRGDGILTGCAVTAQGSPDMTLAVAAGTVQIAGASVAVTGGNVTVTAADATNPRVDLVVVNNSGTKSVTAGTAAVNPAMPAIPASSVVLASVYVPANDTAINTNQITDKRVTVHAVGAPTTVDYLVGTADAGLSNEIAVGTTPGGELGGTWASPTVDATHAGSTHAPTGADYLVGTAQAGLSAEIVVGASPGGELGGTWASPTVDATHAGSTHAPTGADYLVGTAQAGLSAEIVVGATPGGELGGTWASPTVDASHSGSTHQAATTTHEAASDPHPGYVLESLYDAKGDLIAASAADTPAKLTVGADDTILMADAAAAAGLKWVASATPSTQAFADAAAVGTADTFTRGDHKHAMPTLGFGLTGNSAPAVSLTNASGFVSTAVAVSAATYADLTGASVSLAAGTWLVMGQIHGSAANLAFLMHAAITDGANAVISEGSQFVPASGTASVHAWGSLSLHAIVVPGSTTTYKLRAARGLTTLTNTWTAQDGAGTNINNNASDNSDKGTGIFAVRIA